MCLYTPNITIHYIGGVRTPHHKSKCMHACMHACMDMSITACTHACIYLSVHACMHAYLCPCMHASMHVCMHISIPACMHAWRERDNKICRRNKIAEYKEIKKNS